MLHFVGFILSLFNFSIVMYIGRSCLWPGASFEFLKSVTWIASATICCTSILVMRCLMSVLSNIMVISWNCDKLTKWWASHTLILPVAYIEHIISVLIKVPNKFWFFLATINFTTLNVSFEWTCGALLFNVVVKGLNVFLEVCWLHLYGFILHWWFVPIGLANWFGNTNSREIRVDDFDDALVLFLKIRW